MFAPPSAFETWFVSTALTDDDFQKIADALVPAAKAWIKANPEGGVQPWDVKGYKIPGGSPSSPATGAPPTSCSPT